MAVSTPRSDVLNEGDDPLLVFVHIPKTAGTTIGTLLRHHYGPRFRRINTSGAAHDSERLQERVAAALAEPTVQAVQGHISFGLSEFFPADARYATLLRDPLERMLSEYHHLVTRTGTWRHDWLPAPSPELTLADCLGVRSYIPDNLQTRMLCGLALPIDPLSADALEQAKRNLHDRFRYVGTTERFDEFLALLNIELAWPTVAYERVRVVPGRPGREALTPDALRLAEEATVLDRALHEYAGQLLSAALERAAPELQVELEVLQTALRTRADAGARSKAVAIARARAFPIEARVELAVKEAELVRSRAEVRDLRKLLTRSEARIRTLKGRLKGRNLTARLGGRVVRLFR